MFNSSNQDRDSSETTIKNFLPSSLEKSDQLSIRIAKKEEVEIAMDWAAQEGWNVGKYDAKSYFKSFPNGCKILFLNNEPIGVIFLAQYDKDFTFIGLFIIEKNHRGKGFGKMLWDYAMKKTEKMASIGLYAVPNEVSRYGKSGFKTSNPVFRWQMEAPSVLTKSDNSEILLLNNKNNDLTSEVDQYDTKMFRTPRFLLIKAILEIQQSVGFAMKKSGEIVGYGLIRPCQKGYRITLYADMLENAKNLTLKLLEIVNGSSETIIFDSPSPVFNKFIIAFADYFNLKRVEEADTQAMFKGKIPEEIEGNFEKTYAVCSLELG